MAFDLDSLAIGLINAAPDAVFVVDAAGQILLVNDEAERLFGYSRDELLGQAIEVLVPDTLRGGHTAHRHGYGQAPARRGMGTLDVPARRRDGSELWISVSLSPLEAAGQQLVIAIARDVTERRSMQERLRYLGSHDTLTQLYNRGYFDEEIARLARGRVFPVSVLVIDLDGLKQINDRDGHAAGDRLLQDAAAVLRAAFRAEDVVARLGGDEFGVLLPGVVEADHQRAITRLRDGALAAGVELSIGGAIAHAGDDLAPALQRADMAMYADKIARRVVATRAL